MKLMKLKQNKTLTMVVLVVTPSFLQITNLPPVTFQLFCSLYSCQVKRLFPVIGGSNVLT